jgi:hypothetical protein
LLKSHGEEIKTVGNWIREQAKVGVLPHEFGVFVRSEAQLDRAQAAAKEAGLAFKFLDEQVETLSRCPRNTGVLERGRSPERLAQPSNDRSRGARTRSPRGGPSSEC